jgi:hypothetical protein
MTPRRAGRIHALVRMSHIVRPRALLTEAAVGAGTRFRPNLGRQAAAHVEVEGAEDGRVGADDADVYFGEAPAYVGGDGPGGVGVCGGAGGEGGADCAADCSAAGLD